MPIKVKCPNPVCGKTMKVKDSLSGKKGKCPSCERIIDIPDISDGFYDINFDVGDRSPKVG